jgi:antitoxin FitA
MSMPDDVSSNLTLRGLPSRVRAMLATRAKSRHQSLNSYLLDVLTREAETPNMAEVLADLEDLRRPTGISGDEAVRAVRDAQDGRWG